MTNKTRGSSTLLENGASTIEHRIEPQQVQLLDTLINEAGRDECRLRVGDCFLAIRVQQHLVQAGEHTVRSQELLALSVDGLGTGWAFPRKRLLSARSGRMTSAADETAGTIRWKTSSHHHLEPNPNADSGSGTKTNFVSNFT